MADDSPALPAHFSSFDDTPPPASFSSFDEDAIRAPQDAAVGTGLSGIPNAPATWEDVGHHLAAGAHELGATGAGFAASVSGDPTTEVGWRRTAEQQQYEAEQSRAAATPTAQPGLSHPLLWAAEQAPSLAAMAVPAAVAGAATGGVGAPIALGAVMGAQARGDVYNRLVDEGINPTAEQLTGPTALGVATGLASEVTGGIASKLPVSKLVGRALGVTGDAVTFGASGAGQEYASQQSEIAAGKRQGINQGDILGAFVGGAETGASFGLPHLLGSGLHRDISAKGGENAQQQGRTSQEAAQEEAKTRAPAAPPGGDQAATQRQPPSSPLADPTLAAGAKGEVITPESKQPEVVQPTNVQPTDVGVAEATGAPPAEITPAPPSPPPPPPEAAPAPAAAPPARAPEAVAPEPQSTITAQHQDLLDPSNPREAMIYNPGQQPIDITGNGLIGQTRLQDGRVVQYRRDGPNALNPQRVTAWAKSGRLNELLQNSTVNKDQAVDLAVAGVGEPAVVTTRRPDGIEVKAGATTTAVAPNDVALHEATKAPGDTVQVEHPATTIGDRFAKARDENIAAQVTPESNLTIGEQLRAREAERAAQTQTAAQAQAVERSARMEALKREMNQQLATGPAPADRVLRAQDTSEQAMQAAQAAAQERVQGVTTAEEPKPKGKNWTKGELAKKENANQAANEIMQAERNHPKPGEQPNAILARAKGMVAEAKGIHIPTEVSEEGKHGPGVMLLREAKDLIAKDLPKQNKFPSMADYARFIDREGMIREGRLGEALEARRAEGKESVALGSPEEGGAEGVRPGEHLEEKSPEEEVIHREEEEERAKEEPEGGAQVEARERPKVVEEVKEGEHYTAPKTVAAFKVAKAGERQKVEGIERPKVTGKIKLQEMGEGNTVMSTNRWGSPISITPLRSATAREAIAELRERARYSPELRQMQDRLIPKLLKLAGDTPVHWVSHEDMLRTGNEARGFYDPVEDHIILNADHLTHDTMLHELFHAATTKALTSDPHLADLMRRLRNEMLRDTTAGLHKDTLTALKDPEEFLTYLMTNENVQADLKGRKISDELAKDIGIPKWRKATMWNGVLHIIQKALGLEPRDVSAIEGAMAITEHTIWKQDAGEAMQAAGRLANEQMAGRRFQRMDPPERDQDAAVRSHRETFARVRDIDREVMKQYSKDTIHNLGAGVMKGSAKLLSGTWLDDVHGHLFNDAKGAILQAINDAQNRVSHMYSTLMGGDRDILNRGYFLDKTHASQMANYARLVDMSLRYNIHADRTAPATPKGNLWDQARNAWQQFKYGDEARALYNHLPEELQKRYTAEKKYYIDKQGDMGKILLDNILPMFDAPKGRTSEEIMKLARDNKMEDSDWTHYQKLGVADILHEAYRLQTKKDVYFNSQRGDGRFVVSGRYAMPKGGRDVDYSGSELRDDTREFDTEQEAHAFATSTRMKATTHEVNYYKDPKTGEISRVSGEEAASVGTVTPKYQVRLERQNYQVADSRAEAGRNRQAMEADGVGDLTGVMDKRDERSWSNLNTADQKLLERKIDSNPNMTPFEKQQMKDASRQMMLSSRGGMGAHMIQARKVAGARFDSAAGLHAYARAINYHIARNSHAPALADAMDRLDVHEKANRASDPDNALRRSIVGNEYRDRVYGRNASPMGSKSSPFMHKLMTWAFVNFLARPSHILLSQIHPYIYSVPMLAARHGYWKSLQGQRQAMKDLGGMGHNLWEGAKAGYEVYKSGGEQNIDKAVAMAHGVDPILRMINGLKDKGERDAMMKMWETEHLHSAFDASVFEGSGQDRMNAVIRQFTDAMEANNRLSTALNAYRLEKGMHKDAGNALTYSRRVIEQTHGVFSPTNAATIFKNPIIRPIMQFRQQPMNLAIMMYRNIGKSLPEKWGGDANNEARWTLAYQLGTAAALGGMGGMPMDLPKLVGLAGQAAGGPAPSDWDDKFYRTLVDNLGPTAAKGIHDGIPGLMGPYGPSLGHRTGFDAGFLFGEPRSNSADDMFSYTAKSLAGASVGMGMDWLNALHNAEQGNWERAGEYLMPGSLKDLLKTYRNATEGQMAGKEQVAPPSFGDEILQTLGFSSVERERMLAGHYALQKAVKAQQTVQDQLKAKHAARGQSVLGVKIPKKERALGEEYESAYQ